MALPAWTPGWGARTSTSCVCISAASLMVLKVSAVLTAARPQECLGGGDGLGQKAFPQWLHPGTNEARVDKLSFLERLLLKDAPFLKAIVGRSRIISRENSAEVSLFWVPSACSFCLCPSFFFRTHADNTSLYLLEAHGSLFSFLACSSAWPWYQSFTH